jgi:protein gp37
VGKTSIEWTDHSWPVVNGCRRVSAGCERCYAERLTATRLSQTPKYKGLAVFGKNGPRWTGEARLWAPHLDMPLKLKKPSRIFVCDMGDLFYEGVADEEIAAVFGVMAACPGHTFQVLTKRPARAREWFRWASAGHALDDGEVRRCLRELDTFGVRRGHVEYPLWPLPNVWLGVSCEDQATAEQRIPILLDTPAALRFVSAEPLLGPVNLWPYLQPMHKVIPKKPPPARAELLERLGKASALLPQSAGWDVEIIPGVGLDWVIVGGESGPGARPFDLTWARLLVQQCWPAGVPCFVKQLGAVPVSLDLADYTGRPTFFWQEGLAQRLAMGLADRKGGDPAEWPEDLRVRQFPTTSTPSNLPGKSEAASADGGTSDVQA